jgi:hypothetical protein
MGWVVPHWDKTLSKYSYKEQGTKMTAAAPSSVERKATQVPAGSEAQAAERGEPPGGPAAPDDSPFCGLVTRQHGWQRPETDPQSADGGHAA